MFWLVPVLVGGIAAMILAALEREAGQARADWERAHRRQRDDCQRYANELDAHAAHNAAHANFVALCAQHWAATQVLWQAKRARHNAHTARRALDRALGEIRQQMGVIYDTAGRARGPERQCLHQELHDLKQVKERLLADRATLWSQIAEHEATVAGLATGMGCLARSIRDGCGQRGAVWYRQAEAKRLTA